MFLAYIGFFLIQPAKCGINKYLDSGIIPRMPIVKFKSCPRCGNAEQR